MIKLIMFEVGPVLMYIIMKVLNVYSLIGWQHRLEYNEEAQLGNKGLL